LVLFAQESETRLCLTFEYAIDLFKEETIVAISKAYQKILEAVLIELTMNEIAA
jgi:hypothetical protein